MVSDTVCGSCWQILAYEWVFGLPNEGFENPGQSLKSESYWKIFLIYLPYTEGRTTKLDRIWIHLFREFRFRKGLAYCDWGHAQRSPRPVVEWDSGARWMLGVQTQYNPNLQAIQEAFTHYHPLGTDTLVCVNQISHWLHWTEDLALREVMENAIQMFETCLR